MKAKRLFRISFIQVIVILSKISVSKGNPQHRDLTLDNKAALKSVSSVVLCNS